MILELSQFDSQQVIANGEWVNTFNAPINLETGDSVIVNQAFIDAGLSGDYDNIGIPEDITLSLTFGFYYMNVLDSASPNTITYTKAPAGTPLELYVCRFDSKPTMPLLLQTRDVRIPSGNYSPYEIAQEINSQLTSIPRVTVTEFNDLTNMFLRPAQATIFTLSCKNIQPPGVPSGRPFFVSSLTSAIVPIPSDILVEFPVNSNVTLSMTGPTGNLSYNITLTEIDQASGYITFTPTLQFIASSGLVYTNVVIKTRGPLTIAFVNQNDSTDKMSFNTSRYFGATQIALEYNVNQSGKFQWTYQHMPMYDGNKNQGVSVIKDGNGVLRLGDVRSGIFWTNLQPASFWEGLGFDLSTLLVQDGNKVLTTPLIRGVNMTSAFAGLDVFISNSRTLPVVPTDAYFYETTQTTPIIAPSNYTGTDGGFYLIEILGLYTDYQDEEKSFSAIMSVSSKNYDQNGFITVYSDGSIPFINKGDPITISTLHVRILDPITKQPSPLLGNRNSIILDIQKNQPTGN